MPEVTRLRDLKIEKGARDYFLVPPQNITVEDSFNPRQYHLPENRAHLDELKSSIKEIGVLCPLLVRYDSAGKRAILVDGECRLRAVLELISEGVDISGIPVIQVPGNNEANRLLTAITANTGKPLSKWELGGAFRRLMVFGWTAEQISVKTGYKTRFVNESIELSDAPEEVKVLLSEQAVTPSLALSEIRRSGSDAPAVLRQRVAEAQAQGKTQASRPKETKVKEAPSRGAMHDFCELAVYLALETLADHTDFDKLLPAARKVVRLAKSAGIAVPEMETV